MTESRPELATLLPEIDADERRRSEAPSLEEILAYLEGELSSSEEDELQERLSLHPEATQLLLDLADPSRLEGREDDELPVPDPESIRRRLREEGLFDPPAPVVPIRTGVHPFYRWAAAALLAVSVGLGFEIVRRPPQDVPASDVALWELLPRGESGRRDGGEVVDAVPGFSHDLVLYSNDLVPEAVYRVRITARDGNVTLERELRTPVPGRVILRLAEGKLEPGLYEIRLFAAGDASTPLAVYDLDWRRP